MKVLLSWLQEFAPIKGTPLDLGNHMSDLGMAVEEMRVLNNLDGVVVAKVADLRPHPKADRIQLVDVDTGDIRKEASGFIVPAAVSYTHLTLPTNREV